MSISPQFPACGLIGTSGSTRDVFLVDQHVLSGRGTGRSPLTKCVSTEADMINNPSRPSCIEVHNSRKGGGRERKGRSENHASRASMLGSDQFVRSDMKLDPDTRKGTMVCLHRWEVLTLLDCHRGADLRCMRHSKPCCRLSGKATSPLTL